MQDWFHPLLVFFLPRKMLYMCNKSLFAAFSLCVSAHLNNRNERRINENETLFKHTHISYTSRPANKTKMYVDPLNLITFLRKLSERLFRLSLTLLSITYQSISHLVLVLRTAKTTITATPLLYLTPYSRPFDGASNNLRPACVHPKRDQAKS